MTKKIEINLGSKKLALRFNNYSVDAMRKQLLSLVPKADKRKPETVINEIVEQSDMLALQTLIYSGLYGDSGPQFKLPSMTIEEVGEALSELTPEEVASMWKEVNEAAERKPGK